MATLIIGIIVLIAIYFAIKHVVKVKKNGGCVGCSGSSDNCCHCAAHKKNNNLK